MKKKNPRSRRRQGQTSTQPLTVAPISTKKINAPPISGLGTPEGPTSPSPLTLTVAPISTKNIKARPGFGTIGSRCDIIANHFRVHQIGPYQYHVKITPEVNSEHKIREILRMLSDVYGRSDLGNTLLAYDGKKSAFTACPLPFESREFVVQLTETNGRENEFRVNVKLASGKDMCCLRAILNQKAHDKSQETIQALAVLLREAATTTKYQIVGRSLFSTEFGGGVLGYGVEYRKGFHQSLRLTQMGLSLNIDVSVKAFYEPKLVTEFVEEYLGKDDLESLLTEQERIKVMRALSGVMVDARHDNYMRRYKVKALTDVPLNQLTFLVNGTSQVIFVVDYFLEKYNIQLQSPHLPAIQAGTDAKPIYIPMEICSIVGGQRYAMKLNEKQVKRLCRASCQRPKEREASIMRMMNNCQDLMYTRVGMHVEQHPILIHARVLPPPLLKYKDARLTKSEVKPFAGQWNMTNQNFINGGTVKYWATVNFSVHREGNVRLFIDGLISTCRNKHMAIEHRPLIPMYQSHPDKIENALAEIHSKCKTQLEKVGDNNGRLELLFVILPEDKGAHSIVKRVCDTQLGIVSQCCNPKYVTGRTMHYLENVSLKINLKAGGRNVVLAAALARNLPYITECPTIIFGADVTHPSPGENSTPSIAAVVASMDWPEVTKYNAVVSAQPHTRQEIIEDLYSTTTDDAKEGVVHSGMIRELLISFNKSTGHKPHRIIFYRDGVSEGQFSKVLVSEMDKIRRACASLEEGYLPPVTFVVVQKRHHTRFFPVKHGDPMISDMSGNIFPGTVVDTDICHPTEFDFYLCSHAGIQGTSRPTHYHVLHDENKFTADGLQNLTYSLCYTYQRCARSVSIVPPVYYAHLAATRARCYVEGDSSSSSYGGKPFPVVHDNLKSVMYFC